MSMRTLGGNLLWHIRSHGIGGTLRYAMERVIESGYEWHLGVNTRTAVSLATFGIRDPEMQDYHPIPYSGLHAALRTCPIDPATDVFFDYGVGKGRAVLLAARWPFRRVEGIELATSLVVVARGNVAKALRRLQCCDIRVHVADATSYPLPDDVTIVHFYNPFRGSTLHAVAKQIAQSLQRNPRHLTILFAYPDDFERVLADTGATLGTLVRQRRELRWRLSPDEKLGRLYTAYSLSSAD